jgi:hypothetical protein
MCQVLYGQESLCYKYLNVLFSIVCLMSVDPYRNAYRILVGKTEIKGPFNIWSLSWKNNVKVIWYECVDNVHLLQVMD